jgi:acetyltransferase-like isoleucine patch superfamily enzyme
MKISYLLRLILYASQYAKQSQNKGDKRSAGAIRKDMVSLYKKYGIKPSEYLEQGIGVMVDDEREKAIAELKHKHQWLGDYYENWNFLTKYSGLKWQTSFKKSKERTQAYIKRYNMGPHCKIQYGVTFIAEHYSYGTVKIGDYCLFARNCDIDITGDLSIGNGVSIAENAKVLTHNHDFFGVYDDDDLIPFSNRAHNTPLKIYDNVLIGARSIIMPGVTEIGENAIISAGSVVTKPVPSYCVVAGNPAQIVSKIPPKARIYFKNK